jgi:hypothetical protein
MRLLQVRSWTRTDYSFAGDDEKHASPQIGRGRTKKGAEGLGKGCRESLATSVAKLNSPTRFNSPPERVTGYNVVFVGNIPWELSRASVEELFSAFKPRFVRMFDSPGTRHHKGFAHVHFSDEAAVDKCEIY